MVDRKSNVKSVKDIITVNSKTKVEKNNITLVDLPPVQ